MDSTLSVYGLLDRVTSTQQVGVYHRQMMNIISYEIENALILDGSRGRVFSGFQRFSRFQRQVERYRILARQAESVYVFGIPDVTPPPIPNVTYIPLSKQDQLRKEWFVVVDSPTYASILATEELEGTTPDSSDTNRLFKGIWSFNEDMVQIVQEWLTSLVDAHPLEEISRDRQQQVTVMGRSMTRLLDRLAKRITPK
jgi:DICT domain-containing protein